MNIYGYCRISTAKQSIDRQIRNIKAEYPTAHIVQEAYTGTSIFRPEWLKLYRILKSGDTVVFDSVSRMSRNAEEGFALYEDLYHKGIRLVFLKEHHIDTETYKKALSGSIAMTGTNVDFILKGIHSRNSFSDKLYSSKRPTLEIRAFSIGLRSSFTTSSGPA